MMCKHLCCAFGELDMHKGNAVVHKEIFFFSNRHLLSVLFSHMTFYNPEFFQVCRVSEGIVYQQR